MGVALPLDPAPTGRRQLHSLSQSPAASSPGHSRVYSENAIPSVPTSIPFVAPSARSVSANGYTHSAADPGLKSSSGSQCSASSKEENNALGRSGLLTPRAKSSPTQGSTLGILREDVPFSDIDGDCTSIITVSEERFLNSISEDSAVSRSSSSLQMRGLQDQMSDLKGRLSVLRDRARDDTMKRRSLQSLRTPSPFTAAEQWYAEHSNYKEARLSTGAGIGHSPHKGEQSPVTGKSPVGETVIEIVAPDEDPTSIRPTSTSSALTSVYEDVSEGEEPAAAPMTTIEEPTSKSIDDLVEEDPIIVENDWQEETLTETPVDYPEEVIDDEDDDDGNDYFNNSESDTTSLYHDTYPTPISHEDREDAFDYEHFFLHSAMGTLNQQAYGRRDSIESCSSQDSIETARGPLPPVVTSRPNTRTAIGHLRNQSTGSISTLATFATATEGLNYEDEAGSLEEVDDYPSQQYVATNRTRSSSTPVPADRLSLVQPVHDRYTHDPPASSMHRPSITSIASFDSGTTQRSFPLVSKSNGRPPTSGKTDGTAPRQFHYSVYDSGPAGAGLPPNGTNETSDSRRPSVNELEALSAPKNNGHRSSTISIADRLQSSSIEKLEREDQILVESLVASLGQCVSAIQEAGRTSYDSQDFRRRLNAARRVLEGQEALP